MDNKKHHLIKIKKSNILEAVKIISKEGSISRPNLAIELSVTKATVSTIVNELIASDIIKESVGVSKTRGRKPTSITLNENFMKIMSVEIKDDLNIIIFDFKMNIIFEEIFEIESDSKVEIARLISKYATKFNVGYLSISVLGVVKNNDEIMFIPALDISSWSLKDELTSNLSCPIIINNDANLCAIYLHERYDEDDFCVANLYEGVGFACLSRGKLYLGHNKIAGEVGHTIAVVDGLKCPCKNNGCFEQYIGDEAFLRNYHLQLNDEFSLQDEEYQLYIQLLSNFFNNIHNTFNPKKIIILSRLLNKHPQVLARVVDKINCAYSEGLNLELFEEFTNLSLYGAFIEARKAIVNKVVKENI